MAPRPPSDAVVALRSLDRRFRGLLAGRSEDEAADDLACRIGRSGRSALDHVVAATRTITFLGRALEQVLIDDDPVLHPAVLDVAARDWPDAEGSVDERVSELGWEADALADKVTRVPAADWARRARVAAHDTTVSALDVVWDAVDSAVGHLKAAEQALQEVRNQRL